MLTTDVEKINSGKRISRVSECGATSDTGAPPSVAAHL